MGLQRDPWTSVSRNPSAGPTQLNGDTGDGTAFGPQKAVKRPAQSPGQAAMAKAAGLPTSIKPTRDVLKSMQRRMTKVLRKPSMKKWY